MNTPPLNDIAKTLKKMYPGYTFEIKSNVAEHVYLLTVYRNGKDLDTLTIDPKTPMDVVWANIKEWMIPIIMQQR